MDRRSLIAGAALAIVTLKQPAPGEAQGATLPERCTRLPHSSATTTSITN
jgi:hypothetical protein